MRTRSQQYSEAVFKQIERVDTGNFLDPDKKKQYGSLCHNFPIMVLQNGLSQAVAFLWVKANSAKEPEKSPYSLFLQHLSAITSGQEGESPANFQQRINQAPLVKYQQLTRQILSASIWYKRFAESILDVKAGNQEESTDDH